MLDDIDREAEREGFALTSLREYNKTRRQRTRRNSPQIGRIELPDPDVERILKIFKNT